MGKVACGASASPSARTDPSCREAAGGRVCVDKCARGHGLWFDRGELEAVLGMGRFADDRVLGLLKEIFGKK
jgi:Zn-finger nucleic acid-binding protein